MSDRPYLFLGENIETSLGDSIKLFDNYILTRPNESENSALNYFMDKHSIFLNLNTPFKKIEFIDNLKPRKVYNFWIVIHDYNAAHWKFAGIIGLSSVNLTVLLQWFRWPEHGICLHVDELLSKVFYHDYFSSKQQTTIINETVLEEFEKLNKIFTNYEINYEDTFGYKRIVKDFLKIKNISKSIPFRFLYYFTILENLLTNNNYKVSNNSINFQLQRKTNLLNNRFESSINFRDYFNVPDTVSFELIMEKLYHYRSDIAHGNKSNFDKDLFILKGSIDKSLEFIHELTRNAIILALREPQLISDIKNC